MISITLNSQEEVEEVLESVHRSLKVYWGRVQKGDKVAARKWKILCDFRDGVTNEQFNCASDVEDS